MRPRLPEIRLFSALLLGLVGLTVTGAEVGIAYTESFEVAVAADSETLMGVRVLRIRGDEEEAEERFEIAPAKTDKHYGVDSTIPVRAAIKKNAKM